MVVPVGGARVDLLEWHSAWTVDVAGGAVLEQQGERAGDIPQELDVAARLARLSRAARHLAHAQAVAVVAVAGGAGGGVFGQPIGLIVGQGLGLADTGRDAGPVAASVVLVAGL